MLIFQTEVDGMGFRVVPMKLNGLNDNQDVFRQTYFMYIQNVTLMLGQFGMLENTAVLPNDSI